MKVSAWAAIAAFAFIWTGSANATVIGPAATSVSKSSVVDTIGWKKRQHRHKKCWKHHGQMKCRWM